MIFAYELILAITVVLLLFGAGWVFQKTRIKKSTLYTSIVQLFIVASVSCIGYMIAIGSHTELSAEVGYFIYFASMDWLLISMNFFCRQYTRIWVESSTAPAFTMFFGTLDTISLATNFKWHHAFTVERYDFVNGEWCYVFKNNDFYYVHLAICYIVVILIFCLLIKKSIYVGSFQRNRYITVLVLFGAIIALDGVYLLFDNPVDISVGFYAVAALSIGYFSVGHNPRAFAEYMLTTITERMDCALIAYDEGDACIYANQLASRLFNVNGNISILENKLNTWKENRDVKNIPDGNWNDIIEFHGDELRYDVHFNKIYDKKGYYCGCYFSYYDVTSDYVAFEEEKYRASHDSLTGALNRESFYEAVRSILDTYPSEQYVMVCSDIKGFKLVNDMFGLDVADKILIKIADEIRAQMQSGAVFARLEADRFAVFMPKERYSEELFMTGISKVEYVLNNSQYRMNILLGVYEIQDHNQAVTNMCDRAFMAIDSIKDKYKDRIAYYGDVLRHDYMNEQRIIGEFENALSRGEFAMFLQPIVDTEANIQIGEALVRWIHPDRGIITPGEFIPALEDTGYIYKLDMFIWEQAAKRLAYWHSIGRDDISISVNISVKDFYYVDIYETFTDLIKKYHIKPELLKLEITESVFMTEKDRQLEIIKQLKEAGFLIEIDDFGSGYSSLNMLKELPADILKIDMAFLSVSQNEEKGRKIINTVIALAKALDMRVIVEGVEADQQVEYLKAAGCDLLQGYYYDMPLSINSFEKKYLK